MALLPPGPGPGHHVRTSRHICRASSPHDAHWPSLCSSQADPGAPPHRRHLLPVFTASQTWWHIEYTRQAVAALSTPPLRGRKNPAWNEPAQGGCGRSLGDGRTAHPSTWTSTRTDAAPELPQRGRRALHTTPRAPRGQGPSAGGRPRLTPWVREAGMTPRPRDGVPGNCQPTGAQGHTHLDALPAPASADHAPD